MTPARIDITAELWSALQRDMRRGRVGFFLADFAADERTFRLHAWRSFGADGLDERDDLHATLTDEAQAEVIKWAWAARASLVEAHSHGPWVPAAFSPIDVDNLADWVPHLWWRLRGRPYGALVTAGDTLDALAWIDDPGTPVPVSTIIVSPRQPVVPTGLTLVSLTQQSRTSDGR